MTDSNKRNIQWSIREYREGDEEQIRELRGIALSGSRDIRWWKWLYLDGPDGPAINWLAEANEKLVGQYAVLPIRMKIGNQSCKCSYGFDTMTHPDYQRQGIFTTLATKTYESAMNNGISLTYGNPNDQSYTGAIRRLQWFDVCEPPLLVKITNWGEILKKYLKIPSIIGNLLGYGFDFILNLIRRPSSSDLEIKQISSFDQRANQFWLKASEMKPIMVVKDMKYLNWRYVNNPGNEYAIFIAERQEEMVGYVVLKLEPDPQVRGFIVDLLTLTDDGAIAIALISKSIGYLQEAGASTISCLMLEDTPYYRVLRKFGFIRRRSGIRVCARLNSQALSKGFIANPGNWYYTRGDGDSI